MKILMTLESFFPPDTRVKNEAISLIKAGHEVHISCFRKKNQPYFEISDEIFLHRFDISKIRKKSSVGALRIKWYFNFWKKRLSALVRNEKFDAIHIHDLPLASIGLYLKHRYGIKFILDLHENWPELLNISPHTKTPLGRIFCSINQWRKYEKDHLNGADRIIVVIEEAKERIKDIYKEYDNIFVVSNTINLQDNSYRKNSGTKPFNKNILIYEGGITYHRGLQNVIGALSILKEKLIDFEFWIVGTGSYLKNLRKIILNSGLNEHVKIFGNRSQDEVYILLDKADFAVIPHLKTPHTDSTIPHKLFHYMYAGLPVISSNCKPLERIIKETNCGVIFSYTDPESLPIVISSIIDEKKKFKHKYSNAKKWVVEKYNWKFDSENLLSLYKNLA